MRNFKLIRKEGIDTIKSIIKEENEEVFIILNEIPEKIWVGAFMDKWNRTVTKPEANKVKIEGKYIVLECSSKNREENLENLDVCIAFANMKYTLLFEDEEKEEERLLKLEEKQR